MPEFLNPYSGKTLDRNLTKAELVRAIRLDLSAEQEAVHLYLAHADATDDPLAQKVLRDIADEERVHAGEFARLISILAPDEDALLAKGAGEVDAMRIGPAPVRQPGAEPTIGSMAETAPVEGARGS